MPINNPQLDPTNKLRVSSPQALIDTDFEYGTQVSKWENLALTNNRPFAYPSALLTITNAVIDGTDPTLITISCATTVPVNAVVIVTDTLLAAANGTFIVTASSASTSFSYKMKTAGTLSQVIYDANKTSVSRATLYTGAQIGTDLTQAAFSLGSVDGSTPITVTTSHPHGLSIGNEIAITATGATAGVTGSFVVSKVGSATAFTYNARINVASLGTFTDGRVYVRPQAQFLHRPADGGVIFTSNGQSSWQSASRQTRRYFRYQSGKGIQISSGTILKPNFQADTLIYVQSTGLITVTTKDQHNLQTVPPDATVTIYGANEAGFNGTFLITSVTSASTFTVTPAAGLFTADTTASGNFYVSTSGWWGAKNRLGIFDSQNGLFFEFDGQTLYVVRRSSTYQIAGRVDLTNGSTTVSASTAAGSAFVGTLFSKQLTPGDFIVIKGQSYRVEGITSDTSMVISPAYRGPTSTAVTVSKTVDVRVPQSQWTLDKMDGSGSNGTNGSALTAPSGYTLDLTKMQMFYIDYSWYGAGFIRWGLRGTDGDVTYVHKMANNNVNAEAYMRSGNLPGRYESATIPPVTTATASISATDTVINVADTSLFPAAGVLQVKQYTSATVAKIEHVYYSSKTATSFIIPSYSATANTPLGRAGGGGTFSTTTYGTGATANRITISPASNLSSVQIGMRLTSQGTTTGGTVNAFNESTYVTGLDTVNGYIYTSQTPLVTTANTKVTAQPMSSGTPVAFTYSATQPIAVEMAYPTLAPTISHWGTSVIMDGRFDDDKSLLFTYGQSTVTAIAAGATAALFTIRLAPSVDNGTVGAFGSRELINRMQLVLRQLDISVQGTTAGNLLVTAVLNGTPSSSTAWAGIAAPTSSLAQIADYAGGSTTVAGGEVTGGFFVSTTGNVDLGLVRDLGNAVLGGGAANSNAAIYPDGPDTLTILVKNVGTLSSSVLGRLSWTEAQA
jgi:hypothetical protein